VGKEPRYVQQRLALHEKLSVKVKGAFRQGQINFTQARALSGADQDVQELMLERVTGSMGSYYQTADSLERTIKYEQEAKQRRVEAASKPQPADSMFASDEEREAHERQVAERTRKQEEERTAAEQRRLLGEEEINKANTAIRAALQLDRDATARAVLFDIYCAEDYTQNRLALGHSALDPYGIEDDAPCHAVLDVERQDEEEDDAWNERLWTHVWKVDDPRDRLMRVLYKCATPAHMRWVKGKPAPSITIFGRRLAEKLNISLPEALELQETEQEEEAA
jgi:hypothetical protein